jgi:protein-disulfide isomerase
MSSFWPRFALLLGTTGLVVLALFLSLNTENKITFTDTTTATAPTITVADPQYGPEDAAVSLVVFSDYECGACRTLSATMRSLAQRFPNDIRLVFKDMPNTDRHPEAMRAAMAAHCAGKQGAYWEYHDALMATQNLTPETYLALAQQLSLREGAFTRCVDNEDTRALVERGFDEGIRLGVTATPTLFWGTERQTGALTEADILRWVGPLN